MVLSRVPGITATKKPAPGHSHATRELIPSPDEQPVSTTVRATLKGMLSPPGESPPLLTEATVPVQSTWPVHRCPCSLPEKKQGAPGSPVRRE